MTINGGKPHAVGDRGQRYSITYDSGSGARKQLGWSTTKRGAVGLSKMVLLHPVWKLPEITDRTTGRTAKYVNNKKEFLTPKAEEILNAD